MTTHSEHHHENPADKHIHFPVRVKKGKLASAEKYRSRVLKGLLIASVTVFLSLFGGMLGYHFICDLGWVDSLLNASMILTGMGPVDPMHTDAAKIFASGYAIFSGVTFLTSIAILLGPMVHRAMHRFHIDDTED
ncbi:MAG TPA: hypothetical protein VNZ86_09035 [Bacteroidia bacterium]|jgi:hypothetical protein|nr:hypothetical protein [Bacteroidia bacterium]